MNSSLKFVKIFMVTILIGLFVWNSLIVFKYFIVGKKVTSYEDKSSAVLLPPTIFICRRNAFTKEKYMKTLNDFLENTLNLNYSVYSMGNGYMSLKNHGSNDAPTVETDNETIVNASHSIYEDHFNIEHVYSFSRGHCYKFQFLTLVKPYDIVGLYIHPNEKMNNEDLEVYITEPGEEFYVHIFVWRVVPFHFKLDPNIEVVDLTVKKIVSRQNEDCDANSNYDYVECLKSDYKDHSIPGTKQNTTWKGMVSYPNCTLPWQQSMLGKQWSSKFDQSQDTPCNDTLLSILYSLDYEFLKTAAGLNNENCPAPCQTVTYEADIFQMMQNPQDIWRERNKTNQTSFTRYISMYYTSSDVTTLTEDKLIDFSGFVSAIGGNLGLFLGFSFLGMFSSLYEYIETRLSAKSKAHEELIEIS